MLLRQLSQCIHLTSAYFFVAVSSRLSRMHGAPLSAMRHAFIFSVSGYTESTSTYGSHWLRQKRVFTTWARNPMSFSNGRLRSEERAPTFWLRRLGKRCH